MKMGEMDAVDGMVKLEEEEAQEAVTRVDVSQGGKQHQKCRFASAGSVRWISRQVSSCQQGDTYGHGCCAE